MTEHKNIDRIVSVTKGLASIVVPIGAGLVVGNFTALVRPTTEVHVINRTLFKVGEYFIGGLVGMKAGTYAEETIDEAGEAIKGVLDAVKEK